MSLFPASAIPAGSTGYDLEQSLRFNDNDSAYLSWTPTTASNRKTWTWSGWVKRGNIGTDQHIFNTYTGTGAVNTSFLFEGDAFLFYDYEGGGGPGYQFNLTTSRLFRDASAWYHIVVQLDTTQATASDRAKIYINGTQETSFSTADYPTLNYNGGHINDAVEHTIGTHNGALYLDGYLAEVHFIDGTALDPTSFGETGDYGEWKPKEVTGVTYGTNGFYLPFNNDYTVEGFSATTYTGNGANQYIGGVGFSPDLVWVKKRNSGGWHNLTDSVRGVTKLLFSNETNAESTNTNALTSFDTDGFSIGSEGDLNENNSTFVAWSWDMGGSTVSNTAGSITSSVRASSTYGQSVVSYTHTGDDDTVGHGLSSAPELVIIKARNVSSSWYVVTTVIDGSLDYLLLESAAAKGDLGYSSPTATTFPSLQFSSGNTAIAYCFHSVDGYSKVGSYTGNGSTDGTFVYTSFKPRYIMVKATTISGEHWVIFDSERPGYNAKNYFVYADASNSEYTTLEWIDFTSNGFKIRGNVTDVNSNGNTYIYLAFAEVPFKYSTGV